MKAQVLVSVVYWNKFNIRMTCCALGKLGAAVHHAVVYVVWLIIKVHDRTIGVLTQTWPKHQQ